MTDDLTVIACDESGYEGDRIVGSQSPIFAHAAVEIDHSAADAVVAELRERLRAQGPEIKARQVLRPQAAEHLLWLFRDNGPILGHASVAVIDKQFMVTSKIIDILYEPTVNAYGIGLYAERRARSLAYDFHRIGPRSLDPADWSRLLESFNSLTRINQRLGVKVTVQEFFDSLRDILPRCRIVHMHDILTILLNSRVHAEQLEQAVIEDRVRIPALDPLFAALPATARYWYHRYSRPVRIIHDMQASLTEERIDFLIRIARSKHEFVTWAPPIAIESIGLADSRLDRRVQLADVVAGVTAAWAGQVLYQRGTPISSELAPAIQTIVIDESITADQKGWKRLTGR